MFKRIFLLVLSISISVLTFEINGLAQTQSSHFRIISFSVNGKETENFDVFFLLNGKSFKAEKAGNTWNVPAEVQKARWTSSGIRFVSSNFDFSFDNLAVRGYLETDEIKTDYKVQVNTDPTTMGEYLKEMSDKTKRDLGIRHIADVCTVFTLTRLPTIREKATIIADPVALTKVILCNRKN